MSLRASTLSPFACSGEKYWAVPRIAVVCATHDPLLLEHADERISLG